MASPNDVFLSDEHCRACQECLRLNAQSQEILRLTEGLFPALQEFKAEADEMKRIAETLLARARPDWK